MDTILKAEGITKYFWPAITLSGLLKFDFQNRKPVCALKGITFALKKTQILGVLGPNGAGKSTLLKIIATLIIPDEGVLTINGRRLGYDDEKIKSMLGLMTGEERTFYWRLTGRQNLEFFASLYGLDKKQSKARIDYLLSLFKVDYQNRRFDSYSAGMKRKFSLIRALLNNPDILLLDEPAKSLDYNSACELRAFIKNEAKNGKAIIFATHDLKEAQELCDTFLILHKGAACANGTLQDLRNKTKNGQSDLAKIYLNLTQDA